MKQNQSNLYQDRFEHDACGIGAVVSIDGIQEHKVLDDALTIVEKLEHWSYVKKKYKLNMPF